MSAEEANGGDAVENGAAVPVPVPTISPPPMHKKLHGRAFYESIGSPKLVLAPMVDQSEFAWRMLSRSFFPDSAPKSDLLCYTPMFHSRMFSETSKYRDSHFQPLKDSTIPSPPDPYHLSQLPASSLHLDGNPAIDRPLFVQFCSNRPEDFLAAAEHVAPFCDAVDLNLGCPQGIAKRGRYGAFLQEDRPLIYRMIRHLHEHLPVPVTAKMRILDTREETLAYARGILAAGASVLTVHGRRREMKGHNTGVADWDTIRFLRDNLPPDTVLFANGNILQHEDIERCLAATGADGVMSAEGNLYDPSIFAGPPEEVRRQLREKGTVDEGFYCNDEYWVGRDGKGGYRMDAVMRRYLDIIYRYVLEQAPPTRPPLFIPGQPEPEPEAGPAAAEGQAEAEDASQPARKKQKMTAAAAAAASKKKETKEKLTNPNLTAMQAHLFHLLRPLVARHTDARDALARCRTGDLPAFERVLGLVEKGVREGLTGYYQEGVTGEGEKEGEEKGAEKEELEGALADTESSLAAVRRCRREYWVCQPYVRPLPKEALAKGSMTLSKKERERLAAEEREKGKEEKENGEEVVQEAEKEAGVPPEGSVVKEMVGGTEEVVEVPKDGMVCG